MLCGWVLKLQLRAQRLPSTCASVDLLMYGRCWPAQGVLAQELRWQLADRPEEVAAANAATAAKLAYLSCHRLVALAQIAQLLLRGEVPAEPPIAAPPPGAPAAPAAEVGEGSAIKLSEGLSCMVAFARGQERKVYFVVEGLPGYVQGAAAELPPPGPAAPAASGGAAGEGSAAGAAAAGSPAATAALPRLRPEALAAALAGAAPAVVVADPGPRPGTGVVLSAAPLLGAFPRVDEQHPRWLHVQVGAGCGWLVELSAWRRVQRWGAWDVHAGRNCTCSACLQEGNGCGSLLLLLSCMRGALAVAEPNARKG